MRYEEGKYIELQFLKIINSTTHYKSTCIPVIPFSIISNILHTEEMTRIAAWSTTRIFQPPPVAGLTPSIAERISVGANQVTYMKRLNVLILLARALSCIPNDILRGPRQMFRSLSFAALALPSRRGTSSVDRSQPHAFCVKYRQNVNIEIFHRKMSTESGK